jgi:hypothetical protein
MPTPIASAKIIVKEDPARSSEVTTPQQLSMPQFGSRVYPSSYFYVSPSRIRQIRKDATVRLVRQAVVAPIIHTPWTFKESTNAPAGARDYIEEMFLGKRDWLLQGALYGALDFGWMPYELVFEVTDEGKITISKFKQLLQDFTTILVYVDTGDFAGLTNWPLYTASNTWVQERDRGRTTTGWEVELDENNSMVINLEVEGTDWYGISTSSSLDSLVSDWNDVNKSANRYDKKVAGATWVVYYPVGKTEYNGVETSNDEIARTVLSTLEASGGVAIPDEIQEWVSDLEDSIDKDIKGKWRIELISARVSARQAFNDRQKYIDNLIVRVFGIPERSLLEGMFGTKAEAETHAEIGLSTVDTKHRLIVQQFNKNAINQVLRLNWGESAIDSVWIEVAPLVSSRFNHLKEVYRLVLQSPDVGSIEAQNLNMKAIREELAVPATDGADEYLEYEEPEPEPVSAPFGQNSEDEKSDNGSDDGDGEENNGEGEGED